MKRLVLVMLFVVLIALLNGAGEAQAQDAPLYGIRIGWDRLEIYNIYESPIVIQYGYTLVPTWGPHTVAVPGRSLYPIRFGSHPYDRVYICTLQTCMEFTPQYNVEYYNEPFEIMYATSILPTPVPPLVPTQPSEEVYSPQHCEPNTTMGLFDIVPHQGRAAYSNDEVRVWPVDRSVSMIDEFGRPILTAVGDAARPGKFDVIMGCRSWPYVRSMYIDGVRYDLSHTFVVEGQGDWLLTFSPLAGENVREVVIHVYDNNRFNIGPRNRQVLVQ